MAKTEVYLGDALFVVDFDFQKSWSFKRWQDTTHFHADREIHIVSEGIASVEINGVDVTMETGDVCLLAPRSSHYTKYCSENLKKINFSFGLMQNHTRSKTNKRFSEYRYYSQLFESVSVFSVLRDEVLLAIAEKLAKEDFSEESEHIYQTLLALFFVTLAKRIQEQDLPNREQTVRVLSESENCFGQRKKIEAFFQNRYHEEICIEDLADELCLSVPQTHRIVKKVFESGFKKTLIKQRIEHACMLIKQRELPLTEIACCCGYTSYNGFLAAFKSYTGKTPMEYKKNISY